MSLCKMVELFYALIPWKLWQGFLIRLHIEKCPRCQECLASREAVASLLVKERGENVGRPLWTGVESALREGSSREGTRGRGVQQPVMRRWGWTVATAFLIVLIAGFLLLKDFRPDRAASTAAVPARFELEYVRVGGQPANTVVYQPQGSDMIIVWAGKSPKV
jgi:hypothetical protein